MVQKLYPTVDPVARHGPRANDPNFRKPTRIVATVMSKERVARLSKKDADELIRNSKYLPVMLEHTKHPVGMYDRVWQATDGSLMGELRLFPRSLSPEHADKVDEIWRLYNAGKLKGTSYAGDTLIFADGREQLVPREISLVDNPYDGGALIQIMETLQSKNSFIQPSQSQPVSNKMSTEENAPATAEAAAPAWKWPDATEMETDASAVVLEPELVEKMDATTRKIHDALANALKENAELRRDSNKRKASELDDVKEFVAPLIKDQETANTLNDLMIGQKGSTVVGLLRGIMDKNKQMRGEVDKTTKQNAELAETQGRINKYLEGIVEKSNSRTVQKTASDFASDLKKIQTGASVPAPATKNVVPAVIKTGGQEVKAPAATPVKQLDTAMSADSNKEDVNPNVAFFASLAKTK